MSMNRDRLRHLSKSKAKEIGTDPQNIMRAYAIERFLARVAATRYANNFILKGGALIGALIGVDGRMTKDIDATIEGLDLNERTATKYLDEIAHCDLEDGLTFEVGASENIMDDRAYPGIRFKITAHCGKMAMPFGVDLSTGDVITPNPAKTTIESIFGETETPVFSVSAYPLETVLAEKLETILVRGASNTRPRDFYDVYMLSEELGHAFSNDQLTAALAATTKHRGTYALILRWQEILNELSTDEVQIQRWEKYAKENPYVSNLSLGDCLQSVRSLCAIATTNPNASLLCVKGSEDLTH